MELSLIDLHCDTAYEMHRQNLKLTSNHLAISLQNAEKFKQYGQVMALWTSDQLSDHDGWDACLSMYSHLSGDPAIIEGRARICTSCRDMIPSIPSLFLGVEDLRILDGRLSRLDTLYEMGVRFVTPLWRGETCIGGSHNTEKGLTSFGRDAIQKAFSLGMIVDISHASERSADEIFSLANEVRCPVVATHSNAYDICPVSRNLRQGQAESIRASGGVVGLNLYPRFLSTDRNDSIERIIPHIEYFLELGFSGSLCLGCDMDGATLPREITDLSRLPTLCELLLQRNYSQTLVSALFFENAHRFLTQHLK